MRTNRLITYLIFLFVAVSAVAQVNVSGTVVDKDSNEPLTGASVIVKGADGRIKKYSTSKGDGGFAMSLPTVEGCRLEVSMMSFAKKTIPLYSVSFPLTVYLEPGTTLLKEVTRSTAVLPITATLVPLIFCFNSVERPPDFSIIIIICSKIRVQH